MKVKEMWAWAKLKIKQRFGQLLGRWALKEENNNDQRSFSWFQYYSSQQACRLDAYTGYSAQKKNE